MDLVVEKTSTNDLMDEAERLGVALSSALGSLLAALGELDRREAWRTEGATSAAAWATQRLGVAEGTGRVWSQVAERLWDLPHLAQGLRVGALSFDKVRAAVELATPETDAAVLRQAEDCTVRQLMDLVRARRGTSDEQSDSRHEFRFLRFNDSRRSVTAQLPEDSYAEVKAAITERARDFESDGETPYDQRRADALVAICRDALGGGRANGGARSKFFVVAHTDLSFLRGGSGMAEIERLGLLSREAIRRICCEGTVTLALDDAFGHTMNEGRAKRFATDAQRREVQRRDRRCRFPGCSNNNFTNVHHVKHWIDGGPTDLANLVLLCDHHHRRVHEGKWQMSGNANGILRFRGPSSRTMTSRPSPLWTRRN
jgi:hypothetical protein